MQFGMTSEKWGSGSQRWLGSAHGTDVAQSVTLDLSKFTDFDGRIPAGLPLKASAEGGKYEPVTDAGDALAGFLLTDQSFKAGAGDVIAPMVWHGRIRVSFLPEKAFDVTTLTTGSGQFTLQKDGE